MVSATPFVDQEDWTVDVRQILREAIPLALLVGLVAVLALVPLAITLVLGVFPLALTILAQFVLAVGSGVVLLYVVARGNQLSGV